MPEPRRVALLAVGTELTEGRIQDTHLRYLAQELTRLGLVLSRCVHLPDERESFLAELSYTAQSAEAVIVTGGLGPTSDDLTREVLAAAAGVELVYHPEVWTLLERRFAGRNLAESNRRQCYAPKGFDLLDNPRGSAPGLSGRVGRTLVFALPGPPRELEPMFQEQVAPALTRSLRVVALAEVRGSAYMVGESSLEDALRACAVPGVDWGTRLAEDRIVFHLRGGEAQDREAVFESLVRTMGETHIRRGDRSSAELLTTALLSTNTRLAAAESCTGGLLSKWITDLPGSSRVFSGGVVAYSNQAKTSLLGVSQGTLERHGAVSAETAIEMARGALVRGHADWCIAISGVAGPDGGTPEKPVGTVWVAVCSRAGTSRAERFHFPGTRESIRRRSASASCILAECLIAGRDWKPDTA